MNYDNWKCAAPLDPRWDQLNEQVEETEDALDIRLSAAAALVNQRHVTQIKIAPSLVDANLDDAPVMGEVSIMLETIPLAFGTDAANAYEVASSLEALAAQIRATAKSMS